MSSSVSRSSVISPTTISGERKRDMSNDLLSGAGAINLTEQKFGIISEVHDTLPIIKAYDPSNGKLISNNRWIALSHTPQEIVEKFGTIRIGMGVMVSTTGPGGLKSIAQIVANEQQNLTKEDVLPNTVELGLWEIFTPGSGL